MHLPVVPGRPSVPIVARPTATPPREVMLASLSLLIFGLGTVLILVAWFTRAANPWTWRGVFAIATALSSIGASFAVWRFPSRPTLFVGLFVMASSLLRIDFSGELRTSTVLLMVFTLLFCAPLVVAFGRVD